MVVDDDDEYISAAAAHAAFVMTVSAARMYWLLRHAQQARDVNIHKLHPLPEIIGLGRSADFLHNETPLRPIWDCVCCDVCHERRKEQVLCAFSLHIVYSITASSRNIVR